MSFGCGHTQTKTSLIACKIIHILNLMLQSFWKEMDSGKGYEGTRGLWCLIDVLISDSFFNLRYSTLDHFRCLVFIMICSFKWVIITYRLTFVCWFISVSYNSVLCLVFSHVRFFVTPWTIACQAPLSMGILQARILKLFARPSSMVSFQAWESNPGLLHSRWNLYSLSHQGSPCHL